MNTPFSFSIKTMGCKANIYDSLLIERELQELGGVRDDERPDLFVLNSCTVTAEADKQCHREVNQLKKRSPESWTVVTGCYAQVAPEKVAANPNVDATITNVDKSKLKSLIADRFKIELATKPEDAEVYWGQLPSQAGKTRAFLKIQEGCNDYCTYCIIPYARGKSRSVRAGAVLAEVNRLVDLGLQEVIITGTNIGDYGQDWGSTFEDLLDAILEHTKIPRIRLTSLDPSEITDRILNLITPGGRLMPHIHVSLQSPVSRVLRAMKRDYRTEEVESALTRIHAKSSEIFVGMDVIAGFPSETRAEHEEAVAILKRLPWTRLHVFPYSEREGTPALKIQGSVPQEERKARGKELMELSHARHKEFVDSQVGKRIDGVLFETLHEAAGDYFAVGHAPNYLRVMARTGRDQEAAKAMLKKRGDVKIAQTISKKSFQDWMLEGSLVL